MRAWLAIVRKELFDAVRDRRAWMVILFASLLSGPGTLLLLSNFISDIEERAQQREIYVDGAEYAPSLVNFIERQGRTVVAPPVDYAKRIPSGDFANGVLVIPADFDAGLASGDAPRVKLVFAQNRTSSVATVQAARALVLEFGRELRSQRLVARGVAPQAVAAIAIDEVDLGSARGRSGQILFIVPLMALLASVVGAVSVAIDVTAGERERGSLEPLLMNPVSTLLVAFGKWIVVAAASLFSLALSIASFAVAARFIRSEMLAASFQFGAGEAGLFAVVLVPFCLLIAGALMLVATFARGHKEAQAYTSYVSMIVSMVPSLVMFLAPRESIWQLFVPALAQNVVLSRALRGAEISAVDLAVPAAVCIALAALAVFAQSRLLQREAVVFART